MNSIQKIVLWFGIFIIVIMGLFPPWIITRDCLDFHIEKPTGYYLITSPPIPGTYDITGLQGHALSRILAASKDDPVQYGLGVPGARIDFSRLAIQWIIVVVVAGGLILSVRSKSE